MEPIQNDQISGAPITPGGRKKSANFYWALSIVAGAVLLVLGVVAWFFQAGTPITDGWPVIMFTVLGLVVGGAIIAAFKIAKQEKAHEPDYYTFFILGITWIAIGILFDMIPLTAVGAVFFIIGLKNKDKWKKQPSWSEIDDKQKRLKIMLAISLGLLVFAGLVAYFLAG